MTLDMTNNVEQFEKLYTRYFGRAVAFIMSFGVSKEDARDLAQETFVRVYRSMERYRGEAEWGYVQTTARRVTFNKFRDDLAQKRKASLAMPTEEELLNVADKKLSPEQLAAIHESLDRAHAAIRDLPEKKRDCVLWFLGGYTYGEIAQSLGISAVIVKSRLHEARHDLKLKGIELPWSKTQNGT
jgi:RNA polymerase sigma-70 factor (ECF subfamily)